MGAMLEALDKAKAGTMTVSDLRSEHAKEYNTLGEAHEAESKDGWLSAKDLLSGDTAEAKMKDFIARHEDIALVERYLADHDRAKALADNARPAMPERHFTGQSPVQVEVVNNGLKSLGYYIAQKDVSDYKQGLEFKVPMNDVVHQLKAANFTGTSSNEVGGLLPTDRVASIYERRVAALDYFNMFGEPGSIVRYHTPPPPVDSNPGDGSSGAGGTNADRATDGATLPDYGTVDGARVLARGARLGERNAVFTQVSLPKQELGEWMPVNRQDALDNPAVLQRSVDQMMNDVKLLILREVFRGAGGTVGTNEEWNGIDPACSAIAAAGIGAVARFVTNSVPVVTTANIEREPLAFIESIMATLVMRGTMPTAIFVGEPEYLAIRKSQRVARQQENDYRRFPLGDLHGVPLVLNPVLAPNTMYVMDTTPDTMEIILNESVDVQMSEDFDFGNNRIALRVVVNGNCPIYRNLGMFEITTTNNFQSLEFPTS